MDMKRRSIIGLAVRFLATGALAAEGKIDGQLIFPLEHWHNHGSCIVECPNGDMLVCWFHGSGERREDDVEILGARWVKETNKWTDPFPMADTPGFPDTNCCMIIEGTDGNLHVSYSYFIDTPHNGEEPGKSIRYATFNKAWIKGE